MLKEALAFYGAIEGKVRETVRSMSGRNLQCERYDVTTAPNSATGKIGVTQPYGQEIFVPYSAACADAQVGDTVLVVWWKSLSNAKAWFMGDKIGEGGGDAPVTSVNGQTGDVVLNAEDVGAYPIGSIYMSVDSTSPASIFGGTWEQLKDRFLLAAGDDYTAGDTGGSATMAHTHNHDHTHSLGDAGYAKLTAWSTDNNRVTYKEVSGVTSWTSNYRFTSSSTPTSYSKASTYGVALGGTTGYTSGQTTGPASNDDNMPPYLAVYVWKRVADPT